MGNNYSDQLNDLIINELKSPLNNIENILPNESGWSDSVYSNQVDIIISDFIVENGGTGDKRKRICFSDDKIQGTEYELSFILDKERMLRSFNDSTNIAFINFKTISKEYYTYVKTYDESQNRQMDVFTNIENGYGIFAGFNESQDSIIFQRYR